MASPPSAPTAAAAPSARAGVVCDVSVAVGTARSNAAGKFVNVAVNQSLANVVNCLGPSEGEVHSQTTHVWWNPSPLELVFSFTKDYDLSKVLFWNYNTEDYDVDSMLLEFYNVNGQVIGSLNVGTLALGRLENGLNMAETIAFPTVYRNVRRVSAVLNATNGELDFQNLLFVV
jgi:hypothetical protein